MLRPEKKKVNDSHCSMGVSLGSWKESATSGASVKSAAMAASPKTALIQKILLNRFSEGSLRWITAAAVPKSLKRATKPITTVAIPISPKSEGESETCQNNCRRQLRNLPASLGDRRPFYPGGSRLLQCSHSLPANTGSLRSFLWMFVMLIENGCCHTGPIHQREIERVLTSLRVRRDAED